MTTDPESVAARVRSGNRRALAQAITLIESTRGDHREIAVALLERLAPFAGNAVRIGISGAPGVGKSTFIESFGLHVIESNHLLAVLSIDPSSAISGGSILGDKTRMENLARQPAAFIRPSPSGGAHGGVARRTRETLLLCEAAGYDVVIVETVGVGQSETAVAEMTDVFVLLLQPGSGDDLQGIKRGVMELADLVLINKADGELRESAQRAAADYRLALSLIHPRSKNWPVPIDLCSALTGVGIPQAWETIIRHQEILSGSSEKTARRAAQSLDWMWNETSESLLAALREHPEVRRRLSQLGAEVSAGRLPPTVAAQQLLAVFLKCC